MEEIPNPLLLLIATILLSNSLSAAVQTHVGDAAAMRALAKAVDPSGKLGWSDSSDPCTNWDGVSCSGGRTTDIIINNRGISGSLPPDIRNLPYLTRLELMMNNLSGPVPSLGLLRHLETLLLANNSFSSIPEDFFFGHYSLTNLNLDNNAFAAWTFPPSLHPASILVNFSANGANLTGTIPDFLSTDFPSLHHLSLSGNNLAGPIPDLSRLQNLSYLSLRDNELTGPIPSSLTSLPSLRILTLTNNLFQGPVPLFPETIVNLDLELSSVRFCLAVQGVACDPRVNVLLSIAKSFGYPIILAKGWIGNDPCQGFRGISCDGSGNITVVTLEKMGLHGTISPDFRLLPKLQTLVLSGNNLTGTIPSELTNLKYLQLLDVSYNALHGAVPKFNGNVTVNTEGNQGIPIVRDGRRRL